MSKFAERLKVAGKPAKVVTIAVARNLLVIFNAMIRDGREWNLGTNDKDKGEAVSTSRQVVPVEAEPGMVRKRRAVGSAGKRVDSRSPGHKLSSQTGERKRGQRSGKTIE